MCVLFHQYLKLDFCLVVFFVLHVSPSCIFQGKFGRRSFPPNTSGGFHISEGVVDFPTRHLELWALASSDFRGVPFTCEVFQPLFKTPSQKHPLRICIAHPCNRYPTVCTISPHICRTQYLAIQKYGFLSAGPQHLYINF